MKYYGYNKSSELKSDLDNLSNEIENIGVDNSISHSTVSSIEKEIETIGKKIKATDRKNIRIACIRNIKIFGRALQGIFPYALVAGLVFGLQTYVYDVPFVRQDQYRITKHEEYIDNNGIISDKVSYDSHLQEKDSAVYKTKWYQKEDGKYYRTIKEYRIDNLTLEALIEMMNNPDFNVDEAFDQIKSTKHEVKTSKEITEEDLNDPEGFKIVYRYDDTDVILEAQGVLENILLSALYLVITFVCFSEVAEKRTFESDYSFEVHLNRICDENKKINIDELKKLFEEEKIKFSVVKNQQVSLEDPITGAKVLIR